MALDDILATIRAETDAEIEALERAGRTLREDLMARARQEAAVAEREEASGRAEAASLAQDRIVNRARLLADCELRAAAEAVYQEVRAAAEERLTTLRDTAAYADVFERVFEECLAVMPEARFLEIDPRDGELAHRLLERHRLHHLQLDASLTTAGGVALATDDGRRIENTLESRMRRGDTNLRQLVASMIPALRERAR